MRVLLIFCLFLPLFSACQNTSIQIVPQPLTIVEGEGVFQLLSTSRIYYPESRPDWQLAARAFADVAQSGAGFSLTLAPYKSNVGANDEQSIYFLPDTTIASEEGYVLDVRQRSIAIRARSAAGAFYAVQTLRQLFPAELNSLQPQRRDNWTATCCTITDAPRFGYRGLHLDVGRHFFPVSYIKRYIDLLAFHKANTFHWHLTDDQGWRIEIKKHPKLTSVASCRTETIVGHNSDQPTRFDGKRYCGYYTQEEVKEVVEYARQRFVTVVPEIEMPGHALAALSAYPELGCTGGSYQAATRWGVFEDVFCAGNEQTFRFVDEVLSEVCALFPGPYIHIGGDECPKTRWKTCPKCQARMQAEGLKDEHELQSYFIRRAETMLARHGKKLIGWDEILEGGLAPSATVMSWRGTEGGIAAARAHHDVIMTPTSHCYFDYYQSADAETEPLAIGGYLPLEKVYAYEPLPDVLQPDEQQYILGVQANVWTEYIRTPDYLEYMLYPRMCAMSEVQWSAKSRRDWPDFSRRLEAHLARLDALQVNYAKSIYDVKGSFSAGALQLGTTAAGADIRYTTDGSEPAPQSMPYFAPIVLNSSATVKAAAFREGKKLSKTFVVQYQAHKANGKLYVLSGQPDKFKGTSEFALTDGVTGSLKNWKNWVGLVNRDFDPLIDLGRQESFEKVTTHCLVNTGSWIYPPRRIEVQVSADGKTFSTLAAQNIDTSNLSGNRIEAIVVQTPGAKGRYVRVVASTFGVIPAGMPGESNGAWLFMDEIIIE